MLISHSDSPMRRKVGDMAKDRHGNKVFWNNIFALSEDLSLLRILQIGLIKELISQYVGRRNRWDSKTQRTLGERRAESQVTRGVERNSTNVPC